MNSISYNRRILRKVIKDLTDAEFDASLDDFPRVREQFTRGIDKNHKINIILNYFETKSEEFPQLLAAIGECNSTAYEHYCSELEIYQISVNNNNDFIDELEQILPQNNESFWQCFKKVYQDFVLELGESDLDENPNNLLALLWELEILSEQEIIEKFITRLIAYLLVFYPDKYQNNLNKLRKWAINKIGREIFNNQYRRFRKEYNQASQTPNFPKQQPIIYPVNLEVVNFQTPTVNRRGEIINRETKQAQFFTEYLPNNIPLEMVYIPGGKFMMGTEDEEIERLIKKFNREWYRREKPRHKVTVPQFFMGKYQITQEQWKAVAKLPQVERKLKPEPSYFTGENNLPVEKVSWYDAKEFCKRLSRHTGKQYRLASEAEWEYACRAGTTTPFHFGETITSELVNYDGSSIFADEAERGYREKTTPVGKFPPNAFGLYDMHGNVWEWCQDYWHDNYEDAPINGNPWLLNSREINSKYRMLRRGGSWGTLPVHCRSANRHWSFPDLDIDSYGFRVACGVFPRTQ